MVKGLLLVIAGFGMLFDIENILQTVPENLQLWLYKGSISLMICEFLVLVVLSASKLLVDIGGMVESIGPSPRALNARQAVTITFVLR